MRCADDLVLHLLRFAARSSLGGRGLPEKSEFDATDVNAELKWLEKGAVVLKFVMIGKPQVVTLRLKQVRIKRMAFALHCARCHAVRQSALLCRLSSHVIDCVHSLTVYSVDRPGFIDVEPRR